MLIICEMDSRLMVVHTSSAMHWYGCVLVECALIAACLFSDSVNIFQISPSTAFQRGYSTMLQNLLGFKYMSLKWLNWGVVWREGEGGGCLWLMWCAFINTPNGLFYEKQRFILLFSVVFLRLIGFERLRR